MAYYFYPQTPHPKSDVIELINVKFNAMEYAGSDDLWLGIITNLCDKLEERFGKYRSRVFRSIRDQYMKSLQMSQYPDSDGRYSQTPGHKQVLLYPYFVCCLPKFMCHLVIILFTILVIVAAFFTTFYEYFNVTVTWITSFAAITGMVTLFIASVRLLYNICKSLKFYISRLISKSSDLQKRQGLMHNIKQEVRILKDMIEFMQWLENKHFRVILYVDDLERCEKDKCLKLLQAINILLSEHDTSFVSLIAVDPRVMARVIEDSTRVEQTRVNGHEYLKKFIHLPLALPEVHHVGVNRLLKLYQPPEYDRPEGIDGVDGGITRVRSPLDPYKKAIETLLDGPSFISGNPRTVKRLCNILNLVMRLRYNHRHVASPDDVVKLTWWIVMAELWPYRLSLLIHLIKNSKSRMNLEPLYNIYIKNTQLLKSPNEWKSLITLDLDVHNFEFIMKNYEFVVRDAKDDLTYTINLDFSIRETFSLAVSQERIQNQN